MAAKPKRLPKCSYYEGSRKCNQTSVAGTNPPLCRPHEVVLAGAAERRAQHPVVGGLEDLFGAWSRGDEINVNEVIRTGADMLGSLFQGRRVPPMPRMPPMRPVRPVEPMSEDSWNPYGAHQQRETPPQQPGPSSADLQRARQILGIAQHDKLTPELLKAKYRKLAAKHHPDRGGSVQKAAAINHARDLLEESLKKR